MIGRRGLRGLSAAAIILIAAVVLWWWSVRHASLSLMQTEDATGTRVLHPSETTVPDRRQSDASAHSGDITQSRVLSAAPAAHIRRERLANLHDILRPHGANLQLRLFDDAEFVVVPVRVERPGPDREVIVGTVAGLEGSEVLIARAGDAMAAFLMVPPGWQFEVVATPAGLHAVREIDPEKLPGCAFHPRPPMPVGEPAGDPTGEPNGQFTADANAGSEVVLDVMVVYTTAARTAAGGTSAIHALVDLAVAQGNQTFLNSGINARLRLVYCGEVGYTESGSMNTDLDRVTAPADGHLDSVHGLRNSYGADLVVLLTETGEPTYAGIAWLMCSPGSWFQSYAFSVVRRPYVTSHTFIHELGHNLGCAHDRDNATCGAYGYSYGHRFYASNGMQYRTVMAYSPGIRISHFSNPAISYLGAPTGVAGSGPTSANNAQTVNQTAALVAAFRSAVAPPPTPPVQLIAVGAAPDRITLSWQDTATNETGFVVLRAPALTGPWQSIVTLPADSQAYEDTGLMSVTTYHYRVFAVNGTGPSPTTTVASATTLVAPDTIPPDPPAALSASALYSSAIRLTWSASTDSGGSGVAGYRIYRDGVLVAVVYGTNHVVNGLQPLTPYCFSISARDHAGNESAPTGPVCATTPAPPPDAPSALVAVALAHDRVRLTWADNANDETVFRLQRASSIAGPWSSLAVVEANRTEFLDTGVQGGATYYYRVRAENSGGVSAWTVANATTPNPPDETPPSIPGNVTARELSGIRVELRWNASTDTGGSGLAGYRIYHGGNLLGTITTDTRVTITQLEPGQNHCFEVSALDHAGNESPRSPPACATTTAFHYPTGTWEVVGLGSWHGLWYLTFSTNRTCHGWGMSTDGCGLWDLSGEWQFDDRGRIIASYQRVAVNSACSSTNLTGVFVAAINPTANRLAALGLERGRRFAWRGNPPGIAADYSGRCSLHTRIGSSNYVETVTLTPTDRDSLWEVTSDTSSSTFVSGILLIHTRGFAVGQMTRFDQAEPTRSIHVGRLNPRTDTVVLNGLDDRGYRLRSSLTRLAP